MSAVTAEPTLAPLQDQINTLAARIQELSERSFRSRTERGDRPELPKPPVLDLPILTNRGYSRASCALHGLVSTNAHGQCLSCAKALTAIATAVSAPNPTETEVTSASE